MNAASTTNQVNATNATNAAGASGAANAGMAGRVCFVTGGGSGLGAALCRTLAAGGATVIVADHDASRAQEVHDSLGRPRAADAGEAMGGAGGVAMRPASGRAASHGMQVFDVGNEADARNAIDTACDRHGGIDVLINNAGTDVTCALEELAPADWDRVLRTNLSGPFLLSRAAVPHMKRRGGQIINIASTAAKRAWPNASAYHASKWGLLGLSHALHAELRPAGIKVTAVVAGGMRTPFLLDRFPDLDPELLQDPMHVAAVICGLLALPPETVVPEITVLPMRETSWP
jgi:NAD(P)-dependent dehydrogenase (short-subunit alcohol dehydrogenase family)